MNRTYYFDTSIWLDFLEERNEPNMPKSNWARELVSKIILEEDKIIISDINLAELEVLGYSQYDIENLTNSLKRFIFIVESNLDQIGKAKDLAKKRNVPRADALHALIARDNRAILITLDKHFDLLRDITSPFAPNKFI